MIRKLPRVPKPPPKPRHTLQNERIIQANHNMLGWSPQITEVQNKHIVLPRLLMINVPESIQDLSL